MKLKPQNTYKHLLNFVSKLPSRPILNGIHVTEDGHLEATNSHILIRLYNRVGKGREHVIDPKHLRLIEGNYPDIQRLIPINTAIEFEPDNEQLTNIFNFAKSCPKDSLLAIDLTDSQLTFSVKDGQKISLQVDSIDTFNATVAQNYTKIIFDFLKDSADKVTVGCMSSLRPIAFTHEDFAVLLTPVRTK